MSGVKMPGAHSGTCSAARAKEGTRHAPRLTGASREGDTCVRGRTALASRWRRTVVLGTSLLSLFGSARCNEARVVSEEEVQSLNFPGPILLGPNAAAPQYAYVASTNFDLRFRSGRLHVFDLAAVESALEGCEAPCVLDLQSLPEITASSVAVRSFASTLRRSATEEGLYLVSREDSSLSRLTLENGGRDVGCGADSAACDDDAARIDTETSVLRSGLGLPTDPVDAQVIGLVTPGRFRELLLVAYRAGSLALLGSRGIGQPLELIEVASALAREITGLYVREAAQEVWLFGQRDSRIGQVRLVLQDGQPSGVEPLVIASPRVLTGTDTGRAQLEADIRAMSALPDRPERVLLLTRQPQALLQASLAGGGPQTLEVRRATEVSVGASRLTVTRLRGLSLALVSTFDDASLSVFDAEQGRSLGSARQLSGPFEIAVDPVREWALVTDFRASSVRVIRLSGLLDCLEAVSTERCQPELIATIGTPRPVSELN